LTKIEIESIEAELVFLIRQKTGLWPLTQNEIHFNNDFSGGKVFAKKIFLWTEKTTTNSGLAKPPKLRSFS
jgi:hypothetical protein